MDSISGQLSGTARGADVRDTVMVIRATDSHGSSSTMNLHLHVRHTNHPPQITSSPIVQAREDSVYMYRVAASDVDSEMFGDTVRFTATVKPSWLSLDSVSGVLRGIPLGRNVGDTLVALRVFDGRGGSVDQSFTLSVTHTNHPPLISSNPPITALEDSTYSYALQVHDRDTELFGDTLSTLMLAKPSWLSFDVGKLRVFGIPSGINVGDTAVSIRVSDGRGGEIAQTFGISVGHTNHAPRFLSTPDSVAVEDSLYAYRSVALDPDSLIFGDKILYRLLDAPSWLQIDSVTGLIGGVPTIHNLHDTVVTIEASDNANATARQKYRIRTRHTNHRPSIVSDPVRFAVEDSPYVYQVYASDIDTLLGDVVKFSLVANPSWLQIDSLKGTISGAPCGIDVGDTSVIVRAKDREGAFSEQSYMLSVMHINHPPMIISQPKVFAVEDSTYRYDVRATDSDSTLFGDTLQYQLLMKPSWLSLDARAGSLVGTPRLDVLHDSLVSIAVRDGKGGNASQSFAIQIRHTNHAPRFVGGEPTRGNTISLVATEDSPFEYRSHAIDIDTPVFGDSVSYIFGSRPSWLQLDEETGLLSGIPLDGDIDTLANVYATDGELLDTLTLLLHVVPVNDPPTISGLPNVRFVEDSTARVLLTPYLQDPDNELSELRVSLAFVAGRNELQVRIVDALGRTRSKNSFEVLKNAADHFVLSSSPNDSLIVEVDSIEQSLRLQSTQNFNCESFPLVVIVSDPEGLLSRDTVLITVVPQNDPPRLRALPSLSFNEDDTLALGISHFRKYVVDPDDDPVNLQWRFSQPEHISLRLVDTTVTITSKPNWFGEESAIAYVADHANEHDSSAFAIVVNPVNDAPIISSMPPVVLYEDSELSLDLDRFVSDVDNDSSEIRWSVVIQCDSIQRSVRSGNTLKLHTASEDSLSFEIDSTTHIFSIRSTQNFWLAHATLLFTATDIGGLCAIDTVHLSVLPVNDPPRIQSLAPIIFAEDESTILNIADLQQALLDPDNPVGEHRWTVGDGKHVNVSASDSTFTFVSEANWAGLDTLLVIVNDPAGAADTTSLEVMVANMNDAPSISGNPDTLAFFGSRYVYRPTVFDADSAYGEHLHFAIKSAPRWMTIDSLTGCLSGAPPTSSSSIERFQIEVIVSDLKGTSAQQKFPLVVSERLGEMFDGKIPEYFVLRQNYPNPFNPKTRIVYGVAQPAFVRIEIFNVLGQKVTSLVETQQTPGYYSVEWWANSSSGTPVASGLYVYRVSFLSEKSELLSSFTRKMALVK
ncbi:MAG: tandem-95 repeat protein [Ignavibacteriae bacterium]|nr:tandem-95 repeat protein [Ignavibacteriota bacterium]